MTPPSCPLRAKTKTRRGVTPLLANVCLAAEELDHARDKASQAVAEVLNLDEPAFLEIELSVLRTEPFNPNGSPVEATGPKAVEVGEQGPRCHARALRHPNTCTQKSNLRPIERPAPYRQLAIWREPERRARLVVRRRVGDVDPDARDGAKQEVAMFYGKRFDVAVEVPGVTKRLKRRE